MRALRSGQRPGLVPRHRAARTQHQAARSRGLSLVELMVGMALSLSLSLAAVASLSAVSLGYAALDAQSQLQDNARFARSYLSGLLGQAGFQDLRHAATERPPGLSTQVEPDVSGFSQALLDPAHPLGPPRKPARSHALFDNDILILRFQANESAPGAGRTDASVIDCLGHAVSELPQQRDDKLINILHVAISNDGEPNLMCSTLDRAGGLASTQPVLSGVEQFQVLYASGGEADGEAGGAPDGAPPQPAPDAAGPGWLRAGQLQVTGDSAATLARWQGVRSLRVRLVLRNPGGTAPPGLGAAAPQRWRQTLTLPAFLHNARPAL